jgi:glutathione synthase/RimK-type ligase-like ATP-grasp enzyme
MKIALASCDNLPGWEVDDLPLVAALESLGAEVHIPAWTGEVDWDAFDATVIRTTWDYHTCPQEYLDWTRTVPRLFNSLPVIEWNINKSYLRDLAFHSIPIAPTIWIQTGAQANVADALDQLQTTTGFLKPLVGACASDTLRFNTDEIEQAQSFLDERSNQEMMIQPYLRSVESEGELSAIFVGGEFTHGVQKIPVAGDYRVQDDFGAEDRPYTFTPKEIHTMKNIFHHVPDGESLLYARVDYLRADDGALLLNELELIEPSMFFRHSEDAAKIFARAILNI